ncbi:MAG: ABC transporter permease [Firmicutes bacterium]|nr:ABC transporter permease [Bacillota bacterium]
MIAEKRDPLVRMVRRENISPAQALFIRAAALVCALLTGGLMILALGHNPFAVYADMIIGSLGTRTVLAETIRLAIPLLITALAISLAFKMSFWNIGGEGQILFGAVAASYFALFWADTLPRAPLLLIMAIAGALAGGLAGLLPALCKAKWDTNETLFTLMMNYIALCYIKYLQNGPWKDARLRGFPKIAMFEDIAKLPKLLGVHVGWIIALALAALVYLYLHHTKHGYEITVVGESPRTAKYAGMNVGRVIVRTMFLSGMLCGLTGFIQVAGADYTLTDSTAGGVGFTAITVAWLSKLNPAIMVFVSFAIAMLKKGANKIQTTFKIPASAADVLTGVLLFFMLGCEFFLTYRLVLRGGKERLDG